MTPAGAALPGPGPMHQPPKPHQLAGLVLQLLAQGCGLALLITLVIWFVLG